MDFNSLFIEQTLKKIYISKNEDGILRVPSLSSNVVETINKKIGDIITKKKTSNFCINELIAQCNDENNPTLWCILIGLLTLSNKLKLLNYKKYDNILNEFSMIKTFQKDSCGIYKIILHSFLNSLTENKIQDIYNSIVFKNMKKIKLNNVETWFKNTTGKNIIIKEVATGVETNAILLYSFLIGYMLKHIEVETTSNGFGIVLSDKTAIEIIKIEEDGTHCVIKTQGDSESPFDIVIGDLRDERWVEFKKTNIYKQPIVLNDINSIYKIKKIAQYSSLFKTMFIKNANGKENANSILQLIHKKILFTKTQLY